MQKLVLPPLCQRTAARTVRFRWQGRPLRDPRVRLAMNHAINRDGIIKKIFNGYALANASPVATVSYGYAAQEPYALRSSRAKALLAEAGWKDTNGEAWLDKDGEPLTLELLFPPSTTARRSTR